MASVSYSVTQEQARSSDDWLITAGTQVPSAGDIELRFNNAIGLNKRDVILACELFITYLENGMQDGATKPPL
jgi:hypothetical protein